MGNEGRVKGRQEGGKAHFFISKLPPILLQLVQGATRDIQQMALTFLNMVLNKNRIA